VLDRRVGTRAVAFGESSATDEAEGAVGERQRSVAELRSAGREDRV
jgi:hypothetical protein